MFQQKTFQQGVAIALLCFVCIGHGITYAQDAQTMPQNTVPNPLDVLTNPIGSILGAVSNMMKVASVYLLDVRLPEVFAYGKVPSYIDASLRTPEYQTDYPEGAPKYSIISVPIMGNGIPEAGEIIDVPIYAPAGIYIAWLIVLSIANIFFIVALVVVGLIIMFQVKVNQYAMKIILPRFVLALVLAQFSWILCDLLIDVTVLVAWTFYALLGKFFLMPGMSLGTVMQDNLILKAIIQGIQMCLVYGGIAGQWASDTSGNLTKFGTFLSQLPTMLIGVKSLVGIVQDPANWSDNAKEAGIMMPILAAFASTCATGIGKSLMPYFIVSIFAYVATVMSYIATMIVRAIALYGMVIVSPFFCLLFVFPDLKKTVENYVSSLTALCLSYPLIILIYAISYMMGFYLMKV